MLSSLRVCNSPFWTPIWLFYVALVTCVLALVGMGVWICVWLSATRGYSPSLWMQAIPLGYSLIGLLMAALAWRQRSVYQKWEECDGLMCLVCGYDLRGLEHTDKCPECGEQFNVEESRSFFSRSIVRWLRDPRRQHWPSGQRWPGGIFSVLWRHRQSRGSLPEASGVQTDASKPDK
jgi:hypothetical protein